MKPNGIRLFHTTIAGCVALLPYVITFIVVSHDQNTWNIFGDKDCKTIVGATACFIAGLVAILISLLTVALPIALIISMIYLKLVKFSTRSTLLIPIGAHLIAVPLLLLLVSSTQNFSDITVTLWVPPFTLILAYMGLGSIQKREALKKSK